MYKYGTGCIKEDWFAYHRPATLFELRHDVRLHLQLSACPSGCTCACAHACTHLIGAHNVGVVDGAHEDGLHLSHALLTCLPLLLLRLVAVGVASNDLCDQVQAVCRFGT
jgi:hypothetical protein